MSRRQSSAPSTPRPFIDPARAAEIGQRIAQRLDRISDEVERGWSGEPDGQGGFVFSRTIRGVTERHEFDANLLASADARKMRQMIDRAGGYFEGIPKLVRKDATTEISGPSSLFQTVTAAGRKGISLQRYKGLGEMNPEQLWETTLDPNVRTLLKVEIKESDDHDRLFQRADGRPGRAAPRLHPGQRAQRRQSRRLMLTNSRDIIRRLLDEGFVEVSVSGSHHKFVHRQLRRKVIVVHPKKDLAIGTIRAIYKQGRLAQGLKMDNPHYIALIHKDPRLVLWRVVSGCARRHHRRRHSEEALAMGAEVLRFAFEDWEGPRPTPRTLDDLRADPEFEEEFATVALVAAIAPRVEGAGSGPPRTRVSISLTP